MILPDVNVLVYAHREDAGQHVEYRKWLESVLAGPSAFGVSDIVLSGFLRVVTHPRVFEKPTPLGVAIAFVETLQSHVLAVPVNPGPRHWELFLSLCRDVEARGNLVPDAFLAALAIEHGCEWITTDRDFARFPGLRWRYPLAPTV